MFHIFLSLGLASEVPTLTHYGVVQFHHRAQAKVTSRLCPLNVNFLCCPFGDDVVPSLFPPPIFVRVPCSFWNILPVSSLFSSYMPPLRPFLCIQPTLLQCLIPPIVRPPSSVRRRATNPPASADQCPLLVSRPSVPYAGLHPPPTCADGGTWLGCGWRGKYN